MSVSPIQWRGTPFPGERINVTVVVPQVRVERRVSNVPHCASRIPVGSRARLDLNLPIAAPLFRIDGGQDDADFADEIRVNRRGRKETIVSPCARHGETISHRVHCPYAQTRESRVCVAGEAWPYAGHDSHQFENVSIDQGEIADSMLGKHFPDARR